MRFGTGETNITNLALPPIPNRESETIGSEEDWSRLVNAMSAYYVDTDTTKYYVAAKLLFPHKFNIDAFSSDFNVWEQFRIQVAELKSYCRGVEANWRGWETYTQYISLLHMIDRTKAAETFVPLSEWERIAYRIKFFVDKNEWSPTLLHARAVYLIDPGKVLSNWTSGAAWSYGVNTLTSQRQLLGNFPVVKRLSELLANMRILFPDRYDAVRLTPQEQRTALDIINAGAETENDIQYYWAKINFAIATAQSVKMTSDGLKLDFAPTVSAYEPEIPAVPAKRSF